MKSNYKPIGNYIRQIKVKNTDGVDKPLLGINIDKYFMPSVANVVGTDLSRYKLVKKGQFACNRMHVGRDKRLPVALSNQKNDFIVSPAYDVFEIINKDTLLPEYLMMWFSRNEYDRNAWFYTDADVRGGLHWDAFCSMELPVPHIEKQKAIVKEYNTIVNRIKLNEELNKKLEETAQAIYKQWFVDFEFPMSKKYAESIGKPELEGKAYKANGGGMVWNEVLGKEIPVGWRKMKLGSLIRYNCASYNKKNDKFKSISYLDTSNITNNKIDKQQTLTVDLDIIPSRAKRKVVHNDIVYSTIRPNLKHYGIIKKPTENMLVSTGFMVIQSKKENISNELIYMWISKDEIINYLQSKAEMSVSTYPSIKPEDIQDIDVLIPDEESILIKINQFLSHSFDNQWKRNNESKQLFQFKNMLLSKIAKG